MFGRDKKEKEQPQDVIVTLFSGGVAVQTWTGSSDEVAWLSESRVSCGTGSNEVIFRGTLMQEWK